MDHDTTGEVAAAPLSWVSDEVPAPGAIRLAVKENIAIAGRPLRAGSPARDDEPPQSRHAPVVTDLLAAGAHLIGSTRMHELAFGVTGINAADGTVPNPRDPARIPGGSSSGSAAAVALGLADVALGTDTGGSCRIPAALCGVVGYKAGRALPVPGVLPLAPSLDHLGWFTRDVATARQAAATLGLCPPEPTVRPRRLLVLRDAVTSAESAVAQRFSAALAALRRAGHQVVEVPWPYLDESTAITSTIMFAEAAHLYGAVRDGFGRDVGRRLERGGQVTLEQYLAAVTAGRVLTDRYRSAFAGFDAVLAPATGIVAPRREEAADPQVLSALMRLTRLDDLTGLPAMSLPIPGEGLPVGMHLTAHDDAAAFDIAAQLEDVLKHQ